MSLESDSLLRIYVKRAEMLAAVRSFFSFRGVLEVDTPILRNGAPIDPHIEIMSTCYSPNQTGYLHSSPEYGMKELLSLLRCDLYQLSHVFRFGEIGPKHRPEFTMLEWYRTSLSFSQLIEETCDLIEVFLGPLQRRFVRYDELFLQLGIDLTSPNSMTKLKEIAIEHGLNPIWEKEALIDGIFSHVIEPSFANTHLTIITHFPAEKAALAKIEGVYALRFEIFLGATELANGYDELCSYEEQKERFIQANTMRTLMGKEMLAVDSAFLEGLKRSLPDCRGVAVGFDRLLMLKLGLNSIHELYFPFTLQT